MSVVPSEHDVVMGLLSNVLRNRWLPQLVLAYRGATALDRLALLSVEVTTQPDEAVRRAMRLALHPAPYGHVYWYGEWKEAFGKHLHNPRWLAWYLSGLYCHLLSKQRPTRLVWSRKRWEACECEACTCTIYIRRDEDHTVLRLNPDTRLFEHVALPRRCFDCVRGVAAMRHGWIEGQDKPDGFQVPKTTNAFRELQSKHPTELMQMACDLFEQLKRNQRHATDAWFAARRLIDASLDP